MNYYESPFKYSGQTIEYLPPSGSPCELTDLHQKILTILKSYGDQSRHRIEEEYAREYGTVPNIKPYLSGLSDAGLIRTYTFTGGSMRYYSPYPRVYDGKTKGFHIPYREEDSVLDILKHMAFHQFYRLWQQACPYSPISEEFFVSIHGAHGTLSMEGRFTLILNETTVSFYVFVLRRGEDLASILHKLSAYTKGTSNVHPLIVCEDRRHMEALYTPECLFTYDTLCDPERFLVKMSGEETYYYGGI